jgi:hypothetical protein
MSYVEELEKQNDELQQRLAKQQEENIEIVRKNLFAPKWVPIIKVNYPSDPETYHFMIGNTVIAMVWLERNKNMRWNRRIFGSQPHSYDCAFTSAEIAMSNVENELWKPDPTSKR